MGFDWEEILGDTDYEDAVDMAAEALEKMQDDTLAEEQDEANDEANAEENASCEENKVSPCDSTEALTKPATTGAGFMDGMPDEPVFN